MTGSVQIWPDRGRVYVTSTGLRPMRAQVRRPRGIVPAQGAPSGRVGCSATADP